MSALSDLRNEVLAKLTTFGVQQGRVAWLTTSVDADEKNWVLDGDDVLSEGVVEIDDEQVYVRRYDPQSSTAVIAPDGRGWRGTTPAPHAANTRLTIEPLFSRLDVDSAINTALDRAFPVIWGTGVAVFPASGVDMTYALPETATAVLSVHMENPARPNEWLPIHVWKFNGEANLTDWPTGRTVLIPSAFPGRNIQVVYKSKPLPLTDASTDFTDSGLQASAKYAITLGAAEQLLRFADPARLVSNTAAADEYDTKRPYGTTTKIANDLAAQFQRELADEADRIRHLHKPVIHRSF